MDLYTKLVAFFMSLLAVCTALSPFRDRNPRATVSCADTLCAFSGGAGESRLFTFDTPRTVNSLVFSEKGNSILGFTLEAEMQGEYRLVTQGDTVGAYRFCSFDTVTASAFRLTVTDCTPAGFTITGGQLCLENAANPAFRVVSYLVTGGLTQAYLPDAERLKTTTDLIVFGIGTFDENGDVFIDNAEMLPGLLEKCRALNPSLRIHLNLLGPSVNSGDWEESMKAGGKLHMQAMQKNRETMIRQICDTLDAYGFDGVYFDWEFPTTVEAKLVFSSFLVALKSALGDRELGAALASWCSTLTPLARNALDSVEVMAYDLFDDFGYHAAFPAAYKEIAQFLKNGYRKEQLHLGLAFYARPTDAGAYWFNYADHTGQLTQFKNTADVEYNGSVFPSYFNSPQLIRDKTTYALATGLGGVMIWHLACDTAFESPMSLYRVIQNVLAGNHESTPDSGAE